MSKYEFPYGPPETVWQHVQMWAAGIYWFILLFIIFLGPFLILSLSSWMTQCSEMEHIVCEFEQNQ